MPIKRNINKLEAEALIEVLKDVKKDKVVRFVKEFYDGKDFTLPDGCLMVDGKPKTGYSGIDCMHAIATPAYVAGFDDGVRVTLELLKSL